MNNKEALGSTVIARTDDGQKIHLFNRSKKVSVPYVKVENMRLSIKGVRTQPALPPIEKKFTDLGTVIEPVKDDSQRPELYADRKIGPVLEPGEPMEENDVKYAVEYDFIDFVTTEQTAIKHKNTNTNSGGSVSFPKEDDCEPLDLLTRESKTNNNPEDPLTYREFTGLRDFPPEVTYEFVDVLPRGSGSICRQTTDEYPLRDEWDRAFVLAKNLFFNERRVRPGNLPGDRWDEAGSRPHGAVARVNLEDFTSFSSGETGLATASVTTGAHFYLSYGKNDSINEFKVMDLSKSESEVKIQDPNPTEDSKLASGIAELNSKGTPEALTIGLTLTAVITAPISTPTAISIVIAGTGASITAFNQFKAGVTTDPYYRAAYLGFVEKPQSEDGEIKRKFGDQIWGDKDQGRSTSAISGFSFVHETEGGGIIEDPRFRTDVQSGEIQERQGNASRFNATVKSFQQNILVGRRVVFEQRIAILAEMINANTNRQLVATLLLRQPSDDPYLLKNVNLRPISPK